MGLGSDFSITLPGHVTFLGNQVDTSLDHKYTNTIQVIRPHVAGWVHAPRVFHEPPFEITFFEI